MVLLVCLSHKPIRIILSTYIVNVAEITKSTSHIPKTGSALENNTKNETTRKDKSPIMVADKKNLILHPTIHLFLLDCSTGLL